MEELNLYDDSGQPLNKTIIRGDKNFQPHENIKLSVVYLKCKDKYLVQKCSKEKGGEFAITGGHVSVGNTSQTQAVIEVQEELGICIDAHKLRFLGKIYRPHAIFDVYMYDDDSLENMPLTLQKSEVEDALWLTKQQILDLIKANEVRQSSKEHFLKFIN